MWTSGAGLAAGSGCWRLRTRFKINFIAGDLSSFSPPCSVGAESSAFAGAGRNFKMYTGCVSLSGSALLNGLTHRSAMMAMDWMPPHEEKKSGRNRKWAWGGKSQGPEPGSDGRHERKPCEVFINETTN
jgi:hypothetical protein